MALISDDLVIELTRKAINAAATAAAQEVFAYASAFSDREEYEPLEALASRVQHAAVEAGVRAASGGRG